MVNPIRSLAAFFLFGAVAMPSAHAAEDNPETPEQPTIPCIEVPAGSVQIDGFQNDWEEGAPAAVRAETLIEGAFRYDWTGPVDASFRAWCRYTPSTLYLAVVIRDNIVVPPERAPGDQLELHLDFPEGRRSFAIPVHDFEAGRVELPGATDVRVEIARRETGLFLEMSVPIESAFAPLPAAFVYHDVDRDSANERPARISWAPLNLAASSTWATLHFEGAPALVNRVVAREGWNEEDIRFDSYANLIGSNAPERLFAVDRRIVAVSEQADGTRWYATRIFPDEENVQITYVSPYDMDWDGIDEVQVGSVITRGTGDQRVEHRMMTFLTLSEDGWVEHFSQEFGRTLADGTTYSNEADVRDNHSPRSIRFHRDRRSRVDAAAFSHVQGFGPEGPNPAIPPWDTRRWGEWRLMRDGTWQLFYQER